ncbi:ferritin-2, chloroplastic-like [Tasmannia lanceolata]|uniref:ferritin-2, chloroplastic-like n=1 Tax=Tasmannia lanceolata TaxID=3420 RepID=UPI0040633A8A
MLLRAACAFIFSSTHGENQNPLSSASSFSSSLRLNSSQRRGGIDGIFAMASKNQNSRPLTGIVFEPFEEVKKELLLVPTVPHDSIARQKYSADCEAAINEQINVEYNVSYVYHAMFAYFDRDNVALKGLAKFLKESSEEERQHAEKLMEYQNKRGGRVKLNCILMPLSEFDHPDKGDALYGEGHGLVKLYKEIESCSGYADIQVMWEMIHSSCPPNTNNNNKRGSSWKFCFRST